MPQFNPKMPAGTNIFREIGANAKVQNQSTTGQASPAVANDIQALLAAGDLPSMMKAQAAIQKAISDKVGSVAGNNPKLPTELPQGAAPATPNSTPTPPPSPPQNEPAPTPSAGGAPMNVIADLTKLIAAVGKIHGGGNAPSGQMSAQATPTPAPTMPSNAPAASPVGISGMQGGASPTSPRNPITALPGRPTM